MQKSRGEGRRSLQIKPEQYPIVGENLLASIREVLVVVLSEDGHKVESAASGPEALKKLSVRPFDVVITDRAMPHMNGDQFATAVRALYPDMPVILLTGFGDLMSAVGDQPSVFDVVACKPFTADSLRTAIAKALEAHAPEEAAEVGGIAVPSSVG